MALAPKFAGQAFAFANGASTSTVPHAIHSIELYLDYVCPFSAKMFNTLYSSVFPLVKEKYPSRVKFILRQQIQPWHPSSTLVHEAAAAVLQLSPGQFYPYSSLLFQNQKDFFDVNVVNEPRNETYRRLAKLASSLSIEQDKMLDLLLISDKPGKDGSLNSGNGVTNDIKLMVKANRLTGVHVTPTVLFNGIVDNNISSSWTAQQWEEWLEKNVV